MTQTAQIRLLLCLAALTCLTALIGAWIVSPFRPLCRCRGRVRMAG